GILVLRKPKGNGEIGQQGLTFDKLKEAVMGVIEVVRRRNNGADVLRSRALQNELRQYQQDPTVQLAIPNYIFSTSDLPNTHLAQVQWAFLNKHNPGNTANWVNVADRIATIRPSLVGVVDKGIHISDPRLQPALWVNKGEVPGNNKDDDGNGLIDDVHGFNFVSKTATLDWGRDADNHGSFCASQIAARQIGDTNDVISVAPNASVITSVVLGADGAGEFSAILEGIGYAAANGAKVINLSLGGQCDASSLKALAESDFFKILKGMNVVLVAAAGNENTNIDEIGYFPAGLPVDNLITVAAIDADGMPGRGFRNGVWQQYTNYGAREVDMAAPGSQMLGVRSYGKTEMWDGTSMAAPMVTGTVALIQGMHPDWDYKTVIRAVTESVRPYESLQGVVRTGGSLDIEAALDWTP
ncbi:MAG: S8 family serine peptidase, partial [Phycisphaerales bacterium]|nr:S8 family serine peptidase [Phycisphaerales bacterium]